jgi:hypothetical protein
MSKSIETLPVTAKTKTVLTLSEREAGRLRHQDVRIVHLVLAMIRQGTCYGCQVFRAWHADLDKVTTDLEELAGPRDQERIQEEIPYSRELVALLLDVNHMRTQFGSELVGTDHFMMHLLSLTENPVTVVLARHGVMMNSLLRLTREHVSEPILAVLPEAGLVQALSRRGLVDVARAVIDRDIIKVGSQQGVGVREACMEAGMDEEAFLRLLQEDLGYPRFRSNDAPDPQLLEGFPAKYATRYQIFPYRREEGRLLLVCADPLRSELKDLEEELAATITWVVTEESLIEEVLDAHYDS